MLVNAAGRGVACEKAAVATMAEGMVAAGSVSVALVMVRLLCSHSVACVLQVKPFSQHSPAKSPETVEVTAARPLTD